MKKIIFTILFLTIFVSISQSQIKFDDYFESATLRIDYSHAGTNTISNIYLEQLKKEPFWGGSKKNLIDKFEYGQYRVEVYDSASEKLIYSKDYATLFQEWQSTDEAKIVPRSFYETVVVPFPKNTIKVKIEGRDKKNIFQNEFEMYINPDNYFINPEVAKFPYKKLIDNGDPSAKIDVVFIPDGYTQNEMDKFARDAEKFAGYLTKYDPYKQYATSFNFWRVDAPSEESGTDIPGQRIYKRTILNSSFFTFNSERYIMTYDVKSVRDVAGEVPYDLIVILANSTKYGGGAVYNYYSLFTADDPYAELTMVHEFGHLFAGLADEYVEVGGATEGLYDLSLEPPDPNITTLVNFDKKWKDMITDGIPIPTPNDKEYRDKVGAFEGAGYLEKGVYRPQYDCIMRSFNGNKFCVVCTKVITEMIKAYTE
jgi:hypothetical protein